MILKSVKFQIKLKRVLNLTLFWIFAGIFFTIIEYLLVYPAAKIENIQHLTPVVHISTYDFGRSISTTILAAIIAGLSIGTFEIFYFQELFRKKSFGYTVLIKSLIYSFAMVFLIIVGLFFDQGFSTDKSIFHPEVAKAVVTFLSGTGVWAFVVYWTAIVILTQIFMQVRDSFGYGVLPNFILGRYNKPKEERRIFMFLDLKSSTTIAEKLGHIKYHNLLNDFFDDINDSIIFTKGEIYQYIGDEITVSWTMKNGIENENCLRCFFSIGDKIISNSSRYMERFGFVPDFKAGLHCGNITIGEVGVIKKEIVFTGDVLNTASRIQELCNNYGERLLVSKKLLDVLQTENRYLKKKIDEVTLKGKRTKNILYTLERIEL
ncbi:MAG: adenylate/guanylate cyclase domain-containing protein [Ignavibacteriaceae bacterium]